MPSANSLGTRDRDVPEVLRTRMLDAIGARGATDATAVATRCVDAAIASLGELLDGVEAGREAALDLLTVDALVTYAFEVAAARPDTLDALATDAMQRAASLGIVEQGGGVRG